MGTAPVFQYIQQYKRIMSDLSKPFSVYLPHVLARVTKEQIHDVFGNFFHPDWINHVDYIEREDRSSGKLFAMAFVYFNSTTQDLLDTTADWNHSEPHQFVLGILASEMMKLTYDRHWFWKCLPNKSAGPRPINHPHLVTAADEVEIAATNRSREINNDKTSESELPYKCGDLQV